MLLAVLAMIFTLVLMVLAVQRWEENQYVEDVTTEATSTGRIYTVDGVEYIRNPQIDTVLILGLDTEEVLVESEDNRTEYLSDFIGVLVINKATNESTLLQFNRDTMAQVLVYSADGKSMTTETMQLTLAYQYGNGMDTSAVNVQTAVSYILNGIDMEHYIVFGMGAIPTLNDLVGGVEVTITDDFSSVDSSLVMGETMTLTGEQALTYVRSRYGVEDETNLSRMERQQTYLTALFEKIFENEEAMDDVFMNAFDEVSDYMFTDSTVNAWSVIGDEFEETEFTGIVTFEGETTVNEEGYVEFLIDEEEKERLIAELFYKVYE